MTSCARPSCSDPVAGVLLLHRTDQLAELLALDDPLGQRYGVGLCDGHLDRARPPKGWELVDRRNPPSPADPASVSRPRVHGAPGSSTNPGRPVWLPTRDSETDDVAELVVDSPLLRRAFQGETVDDGQIEGQLRLRV